MAKESSSKNTRLFIIIGFVFVIVIGSGAAAYFIAPKFLEKSESKQDVSKETNENASGEEVGKVVGTEKKPVKVTVSMKPLVVNIQGSGGRFLKVKMDMETENEETAKEIEERMAQIRDRLITILTEKKASDISTLEGKRKLKQEIIRHSNRLLKSGRIKKVYFTDFVMQ